MWGGSPVVGGGVSTLYYDADGEGWTAAVRAALLIQSDKMPSGLTAQVQNVGDLVDSTTGAIVGSWTEPSVSVVGFNGPGNYAKGVGAVITWVTTGRRNNRLVKGRTFMVPLISNAFETDGTLSADTITKLQSTAAGISSNALFTQEIWGRPTDGSNGAAHPVVSYSVKDQTSWLRSRKV